MGEQMKTQDWLILFVLLLDHIAVFKDKWTTNRPRKLDFVKFIFLWLNVILKKVQTSAIPISDNPGTISGFGMANSQLDLSQSLYIWQVNILQWTDRWGQVLLAIRTVVLNFFSIQFHLEVLRLKVYQLYKYWHSFIYLYLPGLSKLLLRKQ